MGLNYLNRKSIKSYLHYISSSLTVKLLDIIGGMEIVFTSGPSDEPSLKLRPEKAISIGNRASPSLQSRIGE